MTGTIPLPCLPSDSATSCSTHRPKDSIFASTTNVSLSRPCSRERGERGAEPEAAVAVDGRADRARLGGDARAVEQRLEVDAHQRRRDEPEVRQRAVAPADVGVVEERAPEAALGGERLERRAGVGDRDVLLAVRALAPEVLEQRDRLDRAAGLRRDDEERRASRSTARSRASTAPASVESSTCRRRRPCCASPNERRRTSGARLEPPMPSRTASVKPASAASRANASSSSIWSAYVSGAVSQPSRSATSGWPAVPRACRPWTRSVARRARPRRA